MSTPLFHYIATTEFDVEESDAQHREWLGNMRASLIAIAASGDPIEPFDVYTSGESGSVVSIECASDLSLAGRQTQLRRVADKLQSAKLYGPNPLPNPWVTSHRRA